MSVNKIPDYLRHMNSGIQGKSYKSYARATINDLETASLVFGSPLKWYYTVTSTAEILIIAYPCIGQKNENPDRRRGCSCI